MADHCRRQIRDAVSSYLSANLTTVNSVMTNRVHPVEGDLLPCLLIFTNGEDSAQLLNNEDVYMRALQLTLEAFAETDATVDTLDEIATEVEALLTSALPSWVTLCTLNTTTIELSGEAVRPTGLLRLEYEVEYQSKKAVPDIPL